MVLNLFIQGEEENRQRSPSPGNQRVTRMAKLAVGINVDIQRTNGRIHSAVVSSIDWNAKSVTVEWNESEEIKGKEVGVWSIPNLRLNRGHECHVH